MQPQTPQINPYGAPHAPVGDYVAGDHAVLERARSVPADHGVAWYREAWRLFKLSPGVWIGIWVVFVVILIGDQHRPPARQPRRGRADTRIRRGHDDRRAQRRSQQRRPLRRPLRGVQRARGCADADRPPPARAVARLRSRMFALVVGFGGAMSMFMGEMSPETTGHGSDRAHDRARSPGGGHLHTDHQRRVARVGPHRARRRGRARRAPPCLRRHLPQPAAAARLRARSRWRSPSSPRFRWRSAGWCWGR